MKIIYANQPLEIEGPTIFAAGPTPRSDEVKSWRPQALEYFKKYNFQGTVLIPEDPDWGVKGDYDAQVAWEHNALQKSDVIMFWIPRELKTMPAMTTNCEFGMYVANKSKELILGYPPITPKMRYLDWHARLNKREIVHTLEGAVIHAIYRARNLPSKSFFDKIKSWLNHLF